MCNLVGEEKSNMYNVTKDGYKIEINMLAG